MAAILRNEYTHRKVAETSAKSCEVCFKPTTSVLITSDKADWFYVCAAHLKDTAFCTPKIDQAAVEARKERELKEEMERVKKEYEEKQKMKKDKEAEDKKKDEEEKKKNKDDKVTEDSEKTAKKPAQKKDEAEPPSPEEEEPRVFELKSVFYQSRVMRKRDAEIRKRNRERMQDPKYFPSVPKNLPS